MFVIAAPLAWEHTALRASRGTAPSRTTVALQPTTLRPSRIAARSRPPVAELGLQVDFAASGGSLFVLTGFAALQLKVRAAIEKREARDAARETLRKAEVLLLAGKLEAAAVERAREAANSALAAYEEERKVAALGGVALRIPDPTPERAADSDAFSLEKREDQGDALDPLRATLGLKNPEAPPSEEAGSLLPTGSRQLTLKDVAIGFVFVLQVAWFCLSLTDPMAGGGQNGLLNGMLTSGGEYVDRLEATKASQDAEYRAMLDEAVASGEAPPVCATRPLGDGSGGCGSDAEFARTRGLDASRGFISGPPDSSSSSQWKGLERVEVVGTVED